jgi:hypothetical protein
MSAVSSATVCRVVLDARSHMFFRFALKLGH